MADMIFRLPEAMRDWVIDRSKSQSHDSVDAYLRDLISQDQARSVAVAELDAAISEGFASGISERSVDDVIEAARQQARPTPRA